MVCVISPCTGRGLPYCHIHYGSVKRSGCWRLGRKSGARMPNFNWSFRQTPKANHSLQTAFRFTEKQIFCLLVAHKLSFIQLWPCWHIQTFMHRKTRPSMPRPNNHCEWNQIHAFKNLDSTIHILASNWAKVNAGLEMLLWVDQICIYQNNIAEKS